MTCQKCHKPNPPDAAFCGFCGAKITPAAADASQGVAKTVYGYQIDPTALARGVVQESPPTPAPVTPQGQAAGDTVRIAPDAAGAPMGEKTIPLSDTDLKPAQSLVGGRYWQGQLIKKLPTGELYQARDVKQETNAELLFVDAAVFPSPLDMERARRELRQLQKVECPSLTKVLDHGKADDGRMYIALAAVEGASLDAVVAGGLLDLERAQRVTREVGTALAEAQKMGVIHRDIAPHNVILTNSGEVRLRGFALAPPIKKHIFGTVEYLSPEQASGRPVDQRSNIYSLGALMFFMLTGESPFRAASVDEHLEKHLNEEPVSPRARRPELALSPRAEALILKALAKNSSRRHLTLRQFLREVESLVDGSPTPDAEAPQPMSFVTPLHGVTALTGGRRPPSTEMADAPATAPTIAASASFAPVEPGLAQTVKTSPAVGVTPIDSAAVTQPEPIPLSHPKQRQSSITGEMSSNASLKPAPPAPARQEEAVKPTAPPVGVQGAPGKPGFRETMWFFKGEVESAMAESGGDTALPSTVATEATPQELTAKYADDGSLSEAEAKRLSLRTGKTQMMMNVKIPSGQLPGEKMAAEDFIHEMNRGRKIAIWGGALLALAVISALVVWLVVK